MTWQRYLLIVPTWVLAACGSSPQPARSPSEAGDDAPDQRADGGPDAAPTADATPLGLQNITVTTGGSRSPQTSKGFRVPVRQQKTLRFGPYSDGPTAPWSVDVVEGDGFYTPTPSRRSIAAGSASGSNGDVLQVGATVSSSGKSTGILMTVMSTAGGVTHYMPVLIGAY